MLRSARSIIAEAILDKLGGNRFSASSAGSHPTGQVNPGAVRLLDELGFDTSTLSSKSWDVFAGPDAPSFDIVVTVCDNAAGETCPTWPGRPLTAHWGIPDPAEVSGSEDAVRQAFASAYEALAARIQEILDLPLESMTRTEMQAALRALGAAR
jgi:arsenate reductase